MSTAQYHGKVYRSVRTGTHYTKTPNGNVLYKHPVIGPYAWEVSGLDVETIDFNIKIGYLVEVK